MARLRQCLSKHKLSLLARKTGLILRERKLKVLDFIRICVFPDCRDCFPTLDALVDKLSEFGINITKQSLHNRFNGRAVEFLRQVAVQMLQSNLLEGLSFEWSSQFGRIMILDSTLGKTHSSCNSKYPGFGQKGSGAFKIQYCFDLLRGNIHQLELLSGHSADQAFEIKEVKEKDLWLFDLGYVNAINIEQIQNQGYFLCRYKFYKAVFIQKDGHSVRLDINAIIRKLKVGEVFDQNVYWGNEAKIPVRLILEKLPPEVSAKKRRKVKQDRKGTNVSQNRLDFCDVNSYITNLDQEQLHPKAAQWVYRMRWQVELIFKSWKSNLNIRKAPQMNIHRFECCLWGSLIRIILLTKICWAIKIKVEQSSEIVISEFKAIKTLFRKLRTIEKHIFTRRARWIEAIENIQKLLMRIATKDSKKGTRKLYDIMENPLLN